MYFELCKYIRPTQGSFKWGCRDYITFFEGVARPTSGLFKGVKRYRLLQRSYTAHIRSIETCHTSYTTSLKGVLRPHGVLLRVI